uniref:VPS9 domain containing 1 n=1 Tax=Callorhinchus milii TaxID=7868 RepID=A0A4W3JIY9_CALMI
TGAFGNDSRRGGHLGNFPNSQSTPAIKLLSVCLVTGKAETKAAVSQAVKPSYTPTHRRVVSDGGGTNKSFLTPDVFQKLQLPETLTTKRELTPLEEASRQNQKLKAAYEARMARLNPNQSSQKTSLTLSLQRQMMENLIIAKARQAALQRKMEERRLRLQEEANRRFSTNATLTPEEEEQRNVYASILEFEQDHVSTTKKWLILFTRLKRFCISSLVFLLVHIYSMYSVGSLLDRTLNDKYNSSLGSACCLGSVQDHVKNNSVRLRHSSSVTSVVSVEDHNANTDAWDPKAPGSNIMKPSCSTKDFAPNQASEKNSPFEDLEQDMMKFELQPGSIADNMNLAVNSGQQILETEDMQLQDHLKNIVKDVHNSIDRLLTLCILAFEPLDSATGKDQCLASIEETFFQPIWMFLLALFRKVNHSREMALDKSLKLYRTAGPADVGVSDKLFPHKSTPSIGSYPYEIAVQELRSISKEFCPQKKLECIVRTLRLICDCAEQYCGSRQSGALIVSAIGADDLLPILSYVVLKSNLTQLVSECAALEEFIHEGYLIGEEGYCLTSMQSALLYVESLSKE